MRPVTYHWGVKPGALTHEGIGQLAGEKLADFCSDYKTYVLVPKPASPASEDGMYPFLLNI